MLDAFAHCEKLIREEDKDRYLATLFANADARPALHALYAFDLETARVARRVREPIAGEIRLQWWHDALCGELPDQASGNPVAAAFLETMRRHGLPLDRLLGVIEARRARLYEEPLGGLDVLRNFARQTSGTVLSLAARILNGGADGDADQVAAAAALAAVIDAESALHDYASNVLDAALESLADARTIMSGVPDRVLPAFLPLAIVKARLALMQTQHSPDIPQWHRQWILWRASKNLPRYLRD